VLTTFALVLDGSDSAFCSPVHRSWESVKADIRIPKARHHLALPTTHREFIPRVSSPEFVVGHICKLVGLELELAIPSIHRLYELHVGFEHL
jgi:hypothetical protein